ncbi:MAG: hypothetical protein A2W77_03805 [Nitrospinae bacterium RIFCSPLOWO2_12_39_16]|nr:MAG: hypothetical protein A2W77_03805 [Nitrospinae bacterium RIFCSPLOWO2_12_39_16]
MKITKGTKRVIIYGGVLTGIVACYTLLFEPIMKYESKMMKDISLKTELLNRYKTTLEGRTDIEARSRRAKTIIERTKNRIFFAKTHALAAAQLQSIIQNSAGRYNVMIKSINIKKTEKPVQSNLKTRVGGYNTISLQLVTYSNIKGLIDFLYDLETAAKFININSVTIKGEIVKEASRLDAILIVEGLAEVES